MEQVPPRCWSCDHPIDASDRYCRRCGQGQGALIPWYYRPLWLVVLGLTVLGPFVLPLVWRSPRLDRRGRWAVTAVVVAVTAYVAWELVLAFRELGHILGEV